MRRLALVTTLLCAAVAAPLTLVHPALAGGPTIHVSKTHTGSFVVGGTGVFTIALSATNGGSGNIAFTVTDTLPTGLTYDAAGSGNSTWTCNASGQTVTCTGTPALLTGGSTSFPIAVTVLPAAYPTVTNTATATDHSCSGGPCSSYTNNPASDTANVVLATPPPYTKEPGHGTGFPTVIDTFQATGAAQSNLTIDGTNTIVLTLPAAALPPLTQVTLYKGTSSTLQADLPAGATYIDGYAVAWVLGGQTFAATSAITMTVKDSGVLAGSVVYSTTGSALTTTTATVTAGQYQVSFTADPGFVAASPVSTTVTPTTTPPVPSTGTGLPSAVLLMVLALGVAGLAVTVRRRLRI